MVSEGHCPKWCRDRRNSVSPLLREKERLPPHGTVYTSRAMTEAREGEVHRLGIPILDGLQAIRLFSS